MENMAVHSLPQLTWYFRFASQGATHCSCAPHLDQDSTFGFGAPLFGSDSSAVDWQIVLSVAANESWALVWKDSPW